MAEYPNTFHLTIASVGETRFDGAVVSATLPGAAGELTILPRHEALVTTLKPGVITVRETLGEPKKFPIESGVLECSGNRVVVLL
jgi:F-type H+-transporting ATPase subunit epsilon